MEKRVSQILFHYVTDIGAGRYTMKMHVESVASEIVAALRATGEGASYEVTLTIRMTVVQAKHATDAQRIAADWIREKTGEAVKVIATATP